MLIHIDGLLWLVSFDKLFLSFFEPVLILQVQSIFKMNFRKFVLGVTLCKREGFSESFLIGFKVNGSLNQSILDKELSTLFGAHVLCDLDGNFTKLLLGTVSLRNSESLLPQITSSVHIDSIRPSATFNIVMLSLLEVVFHLKLGS